MNFVIKSKCLVLYSMKNDFGDTPGTRDTRLCSSFHDSHPSIHLTAANPCHRSNKRGPRGVPRRPHLLLPLPAASSGVPCRRAAAKAPQTRQQPSTAAGPQHGRRPVASSRPRPPSRPAPWPPSGPRRTSSSPRSAAAATSSLPRSQQARSLCFSSSQIVAIGTEIPP